MLKPVSAQSIVKAAGVPTVPLPAPPPVPVIPDPPVLEKTKTNTNKWRIEVSRVPLTDTAGERSGFQIHDARFLRLLQSAVRETFLLSERQFERVSRLDQEHKKGFHMMFMQARRQSYRTSLLPKYQQRVAQYLVPRGKSPLILPTVHADLEFVVVDRPSSSANTNTNMAFPQPVSMLRSDLTALYNQDRFYLWMEKSDGKRMVWVWMTIGDEKLSFWMDRKGQAILIPSPAVPAAFYRGTLLDGEVIETFSHMTTFLCFDAVIAKGVTVGERDYLTRMQVAHNFVEAWGGVGSGWNRQAYSVERQVVPGLILRVKQTYGTRDIAFLIDRVIPGLDHEVDGLIGVGCEDPVKPGPCPFQFKIKRVEDHTMDFQARLDSSAPTPTYTLWTYDGQLGKYLMWTAHGPLRIALTVLKDKFGVTDPKGLHGRIVECRLVRPANQWELIRIRSTDKNRPNSMDTIQKTCRAIEESLRLQDTFPRALFDSYRQPAAFQVLQLRDSESKSWRDVCQRSASLALDRPTLYGPYSVAELRESYKLNCDPHSYEGLIESLRSH